MNRLTQVRNLNEQRLQEVRAGYGVAGSGGSYHERFRGSAYVYVGGLSYKLTEGDVMAVMEQYGSVVDVNLVKDKDTGKPQVRSSAHISRSMHSTFSPKQIDAMKAIEPQHAGL